MKKERVLAVVALSLGALAVFGDPYGGGVVKVDTQELATIVERKVDHVTAEELAHWILEQRADYRLIDLRTPEEYAEYHIPGAENVEITALTDYGLARNEKIVLYSGGGIHSAQAWFLLRAKNYPGAYILLGGLDLWQDDVLFPMAPADGDAAAMAKFAQASELSRFFGGSPRGPGAESVGEGTPALPTVTVPVGPAVTQKAKRKRKEGC